MEEEEQKRQKEEKEVVAETTAKSKFTRGAGEKHLEEHARGEKEGRELHSAKKGKRNWVSRRDKTKDQTSWAKNDPYFKGRSCHIRTGRCAANNRISDGLNTM